MDWLTNLLKHLGLSRSIVGAAFVTTAVLYIGPKAAPNYVEPIPKEWTPVVFVVLVFSACVLFFWACIGSWVFAKQRWSAASMLMASLDVSPLEQEALLAMGEQPNVPLNLDSVNYEAISLSRLEVMELMHSLAKKGLVSINRYGSHLVSLTPTGRKRALEIQRAAANNAT